MTVIDARGLPCPGPVLQAKEFIEKNRPERIAITVDNEAARQNVERFLSSQGYDIQVTQDEQVWTVTGVHKTGTVCREEETPSRESGCRTMVLITSNHMGHGDDALGEKLMISFIRTLKEMGPDLWRLVFVNNGVRLTISASPLLNDLQAYEKSGIRILVCGTCLTHFNLLDRKKVGQTTNMLDIVTAMQLAQKVIVI
ncbi:MAG: sulfurtransferase-like selenium metabolism protein YedF [Thermodesulfobacteriota bacterium]